MFWKGNYERIHFVTKRGEHLRYFSLEVVFNIVCNKSSKVFLTVDLSCRQLENRMRVFL